MLHRIDGPHGMMHSFRITLFVYQIFASISVCKEKDFLLYHLQLFLLYRVNEVLKLKIDVTKKTNQYAGNKEK